MSDNISQLNKALENSGNSLTKPRKQIFLLLQENEPLSMNEIIKLSNNIDRASIYRTINLFESLGIVQRLNIGWKYKIELSNDYQPHHHHLSCIKCSKIISFEEDDKLELQLSKIAKSKGFKIQGHQLEIQGICSNCQKS